jgi:hypothetical protein
MPDPAGIDSISTICQKNIHQLFNVNHVLLKRHANIGDSFMTATQITALVLLCLMNDKVWSENLLSIYDLF